MKLTSEKLAVVVALTVVGSAPAFAEQGPWGTPEAGAKACATMDSPECKAEIARRAQGCMTDPREESNRAKMHEWFPNDKAKGDAKALEFCTEVATKIMKGQMEDLAEANKRAATAKAALESVEMPKATMRDPKLEKAVATAYDKDYPGNKIIKVVLEGWSDDYEKDAFGRVNGRDLSATVVNKHPDGKCELHSELWLQHGSGKSFSGPLSARGAGSMKQTEILCSKIEGGGGGAAEGGKKKKGK